MAKSSFSSAADLDMDASVRSVGIAERIRAALPSFTPAETRVAQVVLRDPLAVIHLSVTELAATAEASPATVVRLCTSVGLRGFQDLKITLASESIPSDRRVLEDVAPDDDPATVTHKVVLGTAYALEVADRTLDTDAVGRIVDELLAARRVVFGAVGTSAPLALDASYRLATLGIDASFASDVHVQHVTARMLTEQDVFFAISHTGSTFETLATARAAKASGARTVALTSFSSSPLTEIADVSLVAGSAETSYRVEAMSSRIIHLALLDAIYVALTTRSTESTAALARTEDVLIEHRV